MAYPFDTGGNLTQKAGRTYTYGTRPHAVTSVAGHTFGYDANGNQTSGYHFATAEARTISWTPFNKPASISENGQSVSFDYAADRTRFRKINTFTGTTTLYVDGLYEREITGGVTTDTHYIYAAGVPVALFRSHEDGSKETLYLHRDHLGSVVEITDQSGTIVESFSYDAFGKRREPANWAPATGSIFPDTTARGYTGHEHLDDVGACVKQSCRKQCRIDRVSTQ